MKKLYFVNFNEEYAFVCDIADDDIQIAVSKFQIVVSKALEDLRRRYPKFKSYYQRYWEDDEGSIWIDYGSHCQFYVLKTEN